MDSAVPSSAPAHNRTRTRGHNSKKIETSSFRNNDNHRDGNDNGDDESPEGPDGDHSQPRCEPYKGVRAVGAGGHRNDPASGPTRTTKSRVRGESSVKRKEQNRVAQRAFRQRQKTYFIDLEKEVVEQSSQIQAITKSNQSLMEMMERLQRENIALKAAKAPNFSGIPPLGDLAFDNDESTGLHPPGVDAPGPSGAGEPSGRQHDIVLEEDVLVSVKDLASINKKKKKKQSKPDSTTRQPPPARMAAYSPSRSPSSSPSSRSIKQASPEQFVTSGPTFSSSCYRRQSSNASHESVSQTSALAASDFLRDTSFSGAASREPAQMNVQQVTETINNPTWGMGEWGSPTRPWTTTRGSTSTDASASSDFLGLALHLDGSISTSQQSSQQSVDHPRTSTETHHAGFIQPSYSAGLYDQHQYQRQQEEQQQRPVDLARKYSEALLRYHAEAPVNSMAHGRRATFGDSSPMSYDQKQAGPAQLNQSMVGRSLDDNMISASYNGWMNPWQGNGPVHLNASQTQFEQNMNQMYSQALASQHQPIPPPTPVMFMQPSQAGRPNAQEQSQQLPTQAAYQAKALAGVAPGLKSAAHGGMMPFTENLTPIDGLGPLDNPFRPNFHDPTQSGAVWRDLGDLNGDDDQMYGIDRNNAGMSFDTAMGNTFASL